MRTRFRHAQWLALVVTWLACGPVPVSATEVRVQVVVDKQPDRCPLQWRHLDPEEERSLCMPLEMAAVEKLKGNFPFLDWFAASEDPTRPAVWGLALHLTGKRSLSWRINLRPVIELREAGQPLQERPLDRIPEVELLGLGDSISIDKAVDRGRERMPKFITDQWSRWHEHLIQHIPLVMHQKISPAPLQQLLIPVPANRLNAGQQSELVVVFRSLGCEMEAGLQLVTIHASPVDIHVSNDEWNGMQKCSVNSLQCGGASLGPNRHRAAIQKHKPDTLRIFVRKYVPRSLASGFDSPLFSDI